MMGQEMGFNRLGLKYFATVVASGALLAVSGCSNMTTTAVTTPDAKAAGISGHVHGGNQPVAFATVYLYAAGVTGFGSPATLLATTTTANDGAGSFNFVQHASGSYPNTGKDYSCAALNPASDYLYIRTVGGNTQGNGDAGTTNSAAVFLAPLGLCSTVNNNTFVDLSEVTTAASAAALAQFINPSTEDIGIDGILLESGALRNSMALVANLVNQQDGTAVTAKTLSGSGTAVSGVSVTATPEFAKLNTVADIISACVNQSTSAGANCTALFANAVPPASAAKTSQPQATFPTATDTLQAALYMFLNPTDGNNTNLTALYDLAPANGAPFQPTLTSAPTDWTLAVTYTSNSTCDSSSSSFFANPYDVNVDIAGDVWLVNHSGNSQSALIELRPNGEAASCVPFAGSSTAGGVVDINGNIWYTDSVSNVYRYEPSGGAVLTYNATSQNFAGAPLAITTDGAGNVFFSTVSGTGMSAAGAVYEIVGGANAASVNPAVLVSTTVGPAPARMFPDTAGDIWVTSGQGYVTQLATATSGANYMNGFNSVQFAAPNPTYGITVGPTNNVYISSQDPAASLTVLGPSSGTYVLLAGFPTASNAGGLSNPAGIWLDGAGNGWIGNNANETTSGQDALSVIGLDSVAVSPTGTPNGNSNGGYQKAASYFNGLRNVTIDASGNVWTTNDGIANGVTEVVGAAVPIVNPYAYGLQRDRFQQLP